MKTAFLYIAGFFFVVYLAVLLAGCDNNRTAEKQKIDKVKNKSTINSIFKAPAILQDTLAITTASAVFYQPDSMQLLKIKTQTDTMTYEGLMHEYFFQMRNARIVIKKTWPSLKIVESKRYRYLLFIRNNGEKECIDLDEQKESFGLLVFDAEKPAQVIDMSNIETGISFYLK